MPNFLQNFQNFRNLYICRIYPQRGSLTFSINGLQIFQKFQKLYICRVIYMPSKYCTRRAMHPHVGCSEALWKSRDPGVFGATEGTVGVACKCFGVCMTLSGQPNPNHTRSVSQTRIFRKPVRYTISGGVVVQKWNTHKNLKNPKPGRRLSRPSRRLPKLAPEFLRRLGVFACQKYLKSRSDEILVSDVGKIGTNSCGNLTFSWWKPKICDKVFFGEFRSLSGTRV